LVIVVLQSYKFGGMTRILWWEKDISNLDIYDFDLSNQKTKLIESFNPITWL